MANLITLLRFPLLFIYVALLYTGNGVIQLWCIPFIVFIIFMDMFDGLIARARGEVSLLGSVLDIATDRTFEIILWVVFAHLELIPIVIPLIAITRGTTVDAVRAVGMKDGLAAFDQVKHPISRFLVSSRFMRDIYGVVKGFAFGFLTLDLGLRTLGSDWEPVIHIIALALSWLSITFTIARGLPVLIEGFRFVKEPPGAKQQS
ncbi:MAG: CDP-alcohol phosphatidyltransferase family protein [Chloroflexi bacterium]|nr:CDP-alcohol phosphatidyltransferase family protein [Chloroflexota bacterium]